MTIHDEHNNSDQRDHELSPVSQLPRLTGDEVDDARLIAKLHAAIAKETGSFGVPWYSQGWAKGAMGALALVTVIAVSFSSGLLMGRGTVDSNIGGDPVLGAWMREVQNQHLSPQQVDAGVDALLDNIGPGLTASEQFTFAGDPAYSTDGGSMPAL